MEIDELAVLCTGLLGIAALGAWHFAGLLILERIRPGEGRDHRAVLLTFWGLLLLHFTEILWCAAMIAIALAVSDSMISEGYGTTLSGLVYLAGITFTTLGFTSQSADGPVRLLLMLQSLGGFMLLTWSATFVYSVWERRFR